MRKMYDPLGAVSKLLALHNYLRQKSDTRFQMARNCHHIIVINSLCVHRLMGIGVVPDSTLFINVSMWFIAHWP
jgi:hypothetical protein